LANVYKEKGDNDSAIREYREAKRLNPNFLWARQNLGNVPVDQCRNEVAKAEVVLERALKVTKEAHGAQSPAMADPLQGLGKLAMI
jgi:Tfp pilus assembly protein PilF